MGLANENTGTNQTMAVAVCGHYWAQSLAHCGAVKDENIHVLVARFVTCTVVPTKSNSDVIFCLRLLIKH